jgi:hypothetical protein
MVFICEMINLTGTRYPAETRRVRYGYEFLLVGTDTNFYPQPLYWHANPEPNPLPSRCDCAFCFCVLSDQMDSWIKKGTCCCGRGLLQETVRHIAPSRKGTAAGQVKRNRKLLQQKKEQKKIHTAAAARRGL